MSYQPQNRNLTTGVIDGCLVTANGSTMFDISSGNVAIEDWSNPDEMRLKVLSYAGVTGQLPPDPTTNIFTTLSLVEGATEGTADLQMTSEGSMDGQSRRDNVALPSVIHPSGDGVIASFTEDYQVAYGWAQSLNDMTQCRKACVSGNEISANGSNLSFDRSSGTTSLPFFNAATSAWTNPTTRVNDAQVVQEFIKQAQDPAGPFVGGLVTVLDPDNWDDDGVITSVQGGKWTNQRVYLFGQSTTMTVAYGQHEYTQSLEEALLAIETETFIDAPNTSTAVWIATITCQQGETDASDDTKFRFTNRAAGGGGGSSGGGGSGDMETSVYDPASISEQLVGLTATQTLTNKSGSNSQWTNDELYVQSDPAGVTGADTIINMMSLTQAEYDAIGAPDATTFYVITDAV